MRLVTRRSLEILASSALISTVFDVPAARSDDNRATDAVVFCEPTLRTTLTEAAGVWHAQTDVPARIIEARSDLLIEKAARGARCDLLVLAG